MRPHLGKMRPIWANCTKRGKSALELGQKKSIIISCGADRTVCPSSCWADRRWTVCWGGPACLPYEVTSSWLCGLVGRHCTSQPVWEVLFDHKCRPGTWLRPCWLTQSLAGSPLAPRLGHYCREPCQGCQAPELTTLGHGQSFGCLLPLLRQALAEDPLAGTEPAD